MSDVKLCECGCGQPAPVAKQTDYRRPWVVKGEPQRFVMGHSRRRHPHERWQRVSKFNGDTRREDGFTVFCENRQGLQRSLIYHHVSLDAGLRDAIATMDRWVGEWRIAVISSPQTIWRDLQGTRDAREHRAGSSEFRSPESQLLSKIGRVDATAFPKAVR